MGTSYHQFDFKRNHSTVQQLHRIVDFTSINLEHRKYSAAAYLNVSSAFDKFRHKGVHFKLKSHLSDTYFNITCSFPENRFFTAPQGTSYSEITRIEAGVPNGCILSPLLCSTYASNIQVIKNIILTIFTDDTAIISSADNQNKVSLNIQHYIHLLETLVKQW